MSFTIEPRDEHNELLLSRVRPLDYENPPAELSVRIRSFW